MKSVLTALCLIVSFAVPTAHATPTLINAGLNGSTGTVDCAYRTTGACEWYSASDTGYDVTGASSLTPTSATSLVVDPLRGTASSAAYMSASSYLPELHAEAHSNGAYSPALGNPNPSAYTGQWSGVADANIWGVQGYQYDGLAPFDLTVTATLDSIFSANGQHGNIGHSAFNVAIFNAASFQFTFTDIDTCAIRGVTVRECAGGPVGFAKNSASLYDTGTASVTLHHVVNTGDRFYVGAFLDASVCCGQSVDSSHTLKMAFNDASQLSSFAVAGVALPGAVPEPASFLLVGIGLCAFVATRRRPDARSKAF